MSIVLNLIVFVLCIMWFQKLMNNNTSQPVLPVVIVYVFSCVVVFIISLKVQSGFMDGANYLIIGGVFISIFWIWTTIVIIARNISRGIKELIMTDLIQNIWLIIFPIVIWNAFQGATFKIGG